MKLTDPDWATFPNMVQGDERSDRFLEQALRFGQAAKNARDPNVQRVYGDLAELWRKLSEQVRALRERTR